MNPRLISRRSIILTIASICTFLGLLGGILLVGQLEQIPPNDPEATDIERLTDTTIVNAQINGQPLALEVADTATEREEGLMNRTELGENDGMLFVFADSQPREFWMKDTLISLDIIFLDENLRIISAHSHTLPDQTETTYKSIVPAHYALEVNAGWMATAEAKVGDQLEISW